MTPTPALDRADFRFAHRLRVRWVEVDLQQIVFNGHYLMYVDTAMGAYWRALALPYQDAMAQLGGDLFVRKASLEYHASARYDEVLEVALRCEQIGRSSIRYTTAVFRDHRLLTHGELVYVYADAATRAPAPVPEALREILLDHERGGAMLQVEVGDWDRLAAQAVPIRQAVFVHEQQLAAQLEADGADPQALHALVRNRLGQPLATGRLLTEAPGVARLGRMAVVAAVRGSGVGQALLQALVQAAIDRGDHEVVLHAQASAVPFFTRAGFTARGSPYREAGILHQTMAKALAPAVSGG